MGKIPPELKRTIAANIRACRMKKFPGRGGGKMCAEALGVSPQQWSPWERGKRTPDEARLSQIADFFGVTAEFLRDPCAHSGQGMDPSPTVELPFHPPPTLDDSPFPPSSASFHCPFYSPPQSDQPFADGMRSFCGLADRLLGELREHGIPIRLHPHDLTLLSSLLSSLLHSRR